MIRISPVLLFGLCLVPVYNQAQILSSNGATIFVGSNGVLHCNGGVTISSASDLTNQGTIRITKNATSPGPGNFFLNGGSNVQGSGDYYVEQNWINDANFAAQGSSVFLYGATEQLITSTNGTSTEFNVLSLSGTGVGVDRRKTLESVDARISLTGQLVLNDRELYTQAYEMTVLNPSITAITNDLTFGAEGFVSSDYTGDLAWYSGSAGPYIFPVGSSNGTLRYRPVSIAPFSSGSSLFKVHLNNELADVYSLPLSQNDIHIATANTLFFHSITRPVGNSIADIAIAFDPAQDGDWSSMAQWRFNNDQWNWVGETVLPNFGMYSSVSKIDWEFLDPSHPFILATIDDQLIIPNVFTPNNDGVNDLYYVTSNSITEFDMVIVNRWGEKVFETNDITVPWDGTTNGKLCNDGTYFYLIRAQAATGEIVKQGHITIE